MNKERNKDFSNFFDFKISNQYIKNKKRKKKIENFYKQNPLNNRLNNKIQIISSNSNIKSNDISDIKSFNNNNFERNISFVKKENIIPNSLFSENKNIETKPTITNQIVENKSFENLKNKNAEISLFSNDNEDFSLSQNEKNNNKKTIKSIINDNKKETNNIIENEKQLYKENVEENNYIPICTKYKLNPPIEKLCALRENDLKNVNDFSLYDKDLGIIISFLNPVNLNYVNFDDLNISENYKFTINNLDPNCPLKKILGAVVIEVLNVRIQDDNMELLDIYLKNFKSNEYKYEKSTNILSLLSDLSKLIK